MHAKYCRKVKPDQETPTAETSTAETSTASGPSSSSSTLKLKCVLCRAIFFGAEELRLHGIEHHKNERDFHCNWCAANFRLKTDLIRHALESHHSETKKEKTPTAVSVTVNDGNFPGSSSVTYHDHDYLETAAVPADDNDNDDQITGSTDDDDDDNMDVNETASATSTSELNPNVGVGFCPICKKSLRNAMTLQIHMERVHKVSFCVFCRKKVGRLKLHLESCSMAPMLKNCSSCKLSFDNATDLYLHLKNEHSNSHCEFCLDIVMDLSEHLKTCPNQPGRVGTSKSSKYPEACPLCRMTFPSVASLRMHVAVSHQMTLCIFCKEAVRVIKLHECEKMLKCYKRRVPDDAVSKMRTAAKLNLEVCWECKKYFSSVEKLQQHIEDDHGVDYCRFCKSKVEDPEAHLEASSKKDDLCCRICSQAFDNFEDLKEHFDLVHEEVRIVLNFDPRPHSDFDLE